MCLDTHFYYLFVRLLAVIDLRFETDDQQLVDKVYIIPISPASVLWDHIENEKTPAAGDFNPVAF